MNNREKILIIDDEMAPRESIRMVLKDRYAVATATGALEGLNMIAQEPVDLVVMDIKMPRMDGIEVLEEVRKDPALKLIPVVMLTSSRQDKDLLDSYINGVNAYVVKPVDFTKFSELMDTLGSYWMGWNKNPISN